MKKTLSSLLLGSFLLATTVAEASEAITTASLNFRDGPGTAYAVRGSVPAGETITVRTCSGDWCQINYGSRIGWASARYLAFRSGDEVYDSYTNTPISSSVNVFVIGGGYYDGDWYRHNRHYRSRPPYWDGHHRPPPPPPPPPHWNGHHRPPPPPPPGWWGDRPHRPPPGMRPPPFRPGPTMPPPGGRPPDWSHGPRFPHSGGPYGPFHNGNRD